MNENMQAVEACPEIGAREGDFVVVHGDRATVFHTVPASKLTPQVRERLAKVRVRS